MPREAKVKLLVVDDDKNHCNVLVTLIADWGYLAEGVHDGESAVTLCRERPFDLILMDVRMSGISGIEALKEIKAYNPSIPILIMTAYSDIETAVIAIKAGAYDYLTKPLDFDELKLTLERALDHTMLREENKMLKDTLGNSFDARGVIGRSRAMVQLLEILSTVAPSEATVLITGESGTGKELAAKILHANSGRSRGPFVAVNCAALSETLLESELFGHEKGAFTGAEKQRDGKFLAANRGTIFLDEIGEMSPSMQAKLLRAIQEREIQRVGGDRTVNVDVRIVAATNRDLQREVEVGTFRQDLFYRLNVVTLNLPPLRERGEDIPILAAHFLKHYSGRNGKLVKGFTPGAMDRLLKHNWPGNVRELENTIERAVVLLVGEYVSERELPPAMVGQNDNSSRKITLSGMTLDELENAAVREMIENTGGNKSEAARRLGITRKTLQSKLQKMNSEGRSQAR
ncbi:MAG: sigma 54-interacting transcriptional regulator [Planctomycetota bacterium]|jgi:two-component system response regulator HydG|nr:sigma 54-interacting transcriptional regulator [Planctomycetota bacterium]